MSVIIIIYFYVSVPLQTFCLQDDEERDKSCWCDACRVHLEKAATGAVIPQLVIGKPKDDVELQKLETDEAQNEESETYEFRWQEKVFSQVQVHPFFTSFFRCSAICHDWHPFFRVSYPPPSISSFCMSRFPLDHPASCRLACVPVKLLLHHAVYCLQ